MEIVPAHSVTARANSCTLCGVNTMSVRVRALDRRSDRDFRKEECLSERESRERFASALRKLGGKRDSSKMRAADWFVRGLLAFDAALLILTVVPPFSGIWSEPGLASRLLGDDRFRALGFRADVVWMFWSTVVICVAGLRPTVESGAERTTSNLCWKWLLCFFFYLYYVMVHMF